MSLKIYYDLSLKKLARELRKRGTMAEAILWSHLKGRRMGGYDFRRQKPIEQYIVVFYCPALHLIIEIDGESHTPKGKEDMEREERLLSLGFDLLLFADADVKTNREGVLMRIRRWIREGEETHP